MVELAELEVNEEEVEWMEKKKESHNFEEEEATWIRSKSGKVGMKR